MAIKKKIKRKPANEYFEEANIPSGELGVSAKSAAGPMGPGAKTSFDSGISQGIKAAISSNPSLQNMTEQTIAAEQAVENLPKKAPMMKAMVKNKQKRKEPSPEEIEEYKNYLKQPLNKRLMSKVKISKRRGN